MMDKVGTMNDMTTFDGASNVQKGHDEIAAKCFKVTIIHRAEHVASLFKVHIMMEEPMQLA